MGTVADRIVRHPYEAGFAIVFPDDEEQRWGAPEWLPHRLGVDDVAFLFALVDRLVADGVARPGPVFLVGLSKGAFFVEHVARHGLLAVNGIALVAGTACELSRAGAPSPKHPTAVVCIEGTGDPIVPYAGGAMGPSGQFGRFVARRAGRRHGGPQLMPARLIGPVARCLDAAGIVLDVAGAAIVAPE